MTQQAAAETVFTILSELLRCSRIAQSNRYLQHGNTSVLLHCTAVAYYSLRFMELLPLNYDRKSLLRGALLHDYFLYDWHHPDPSHRLHGFHHPRKALNNAQAEFTLTAIESDLILHHMFPLTLIPPQHREALAVSLIDKGCSIYEALCRNPYPLLRRRLSETIKK